MEEKPFNPTKDTTEARLLKKCVCACVRACARARARACCKLRQRRIYWSVCLQHQISPTVSPPLAPSHLRHRPPPQFILTFKVRQTGPFVSSPGRPQDSERQQTPCFNLVPGFSKSSGRLHATFNSGKSLCMGGELGRHGKGREGGRAWGQGLCGGLTEPEEPGTAPHSPRPALPLGPQWHSGLLAWNRIQSVSPQIPNFSLPGYFRFVLNKRSCFKKKCCYNTQPEAFSPAVSVSCMRSV